jgi:protoporphyrinogen oxidase
LYYVSWKNGKDGFDKILLTVPTPIAYNLLPIIRNTYPKPQPQIPHLHAQMLILETDKPVLKNIYWLNINDRSFPFLAAVVHTNFMDKNHYGGHHLTYFGNYLPDNHPYLTFTKDALLETFLPFIHRISDIRNSQFVIRNSYLFTAPFAQPVHELYYSQKAPKMDTGIPGIYIANMDSIFPWDRGINYAVEMGEKATTVIMAE